MSMYLFNIHILVVLVYNLDSFRFFETTGFQGCIGCIDCTHVAIAPPNKDPLNAHPEYIYVNRKGYHSVNVQLVDYLYYYIIYLVLVYKNKIYKIMFRYVIQN